MYGKTDNLVSSGLIKVRLKSPHIASEIHTWDIHPSSLSSLFIAMIPIGA